MPHPAGAKEPTRNFFIALAARCCTFSGMGTAEFVDVDGLRIAYRSAGEGTPLVLLHGFKKQRQHEKRELTKAHSLLEEYIESQIGV